MIVRRTAAWLTENCATPLAIALIVSLVSPGAVAQTRLSPEDCRAVTAHLPDPSVTYQPGVGVGGRRVAPADLSPQPRVVPEAPVIYLGVDLQRRYGLPRSLDVDLPLGILTFDGARLLLNGRPLGAEDHAALAAACAAARRR
jgi:hypothetical protein